MAEWSALLAGTPGASPAQGPRYCALAYEHALPPGAAPLIVIARRERRLAGVWPLWIVRERGARIARMPGGGSNEEYGGPLASDEGALIAMLARVRREADVLHLCNIPAASPLARLAGTFGAQVDRIRSPLVRCGGAGGFEHWLAARSKSFRQGLRAQRRRLAALGTLRSGAVEPGEIDAFVDWLFDTKARWLDARGRQESWLRLPAARAFAKAALRDPASAMGAHGLWIDGCPVAGALFLVGNVYEYFVTTYDPAFALYSPGHVLTGDLVAEAIAARLDFDFRITHDPYKARWSDDVDPRLSMLVGTSVRATPVLAAAHVRAARAAFGRWRRGLRA